MICPSCQHDNLPGADECGHCGQDLRSLDVPRPREEFPRRLMKTPVREVYPRPPLQVPTDAPVRRAIEMMQANRQGCVLVADGGHLKGILTERDILKKVAGESVDLDRLRVSEVMTANPVSLRADDTLAFAMNRLSVGGYRHLPVLDGDRLIGFLSVRCMLKYIADQILGAPLGS